MTMIRPCGSCGNRSVVSKERWTRSVRPRLRQLPQGGFDLRTSLDSSVDGRVSVLLFEGEWRLIIERRVPPPRIVEALDEVEDRESGLSRRAQGDAIEQLAFQRGKETLAQRVVIAVADRAHRGADASGAAAEAEADRRVLTALIRVMDDILRLPLGDGHVQRGQHQ